MISPFMLPPVVVGMMSIVILDPSLGAANYILQSRRPAAIEFLASPRLRDPDRRAVDTWQWTPFVALIVLGGLQSLPPSVYEAARDRRRLAQAVPRITLPLLLPTLVTAAVLRSVDLLRFFDIIYITTQGGPGNASTTLNILAFRVGFEFFEIGYASALMITLSAIVLGAVLVLQPDARRGRMVRMGAHERRTDPPRRLDRARLNVACSSVLAGIIVWRRRCGWCCRRSSRVEVTAYPPTLSSRRRSRTTAAVPATPFLDYTLNSLIVTVGSTLLGLVLGVPAAFAVSWHADHLAGDVTLRRAWRRARCSCCRGS